MAEPRDYIAVAALAFSVGSVVVGGLISYIRSVSEKARDKIDGDTADRLKNLETKSHASELDLARLDGELKLAQANITSLQQTHVTRAEINSRIAAVEAVTTELKTSMSEMNSILHELKHYLLPDRASRTRTGE